MLHNISRRQTLKLGGALGALAVSGTMSHAQAPKRGGVFKVAKAHGATTDVLDPGTYTNGFMTAHGFIYGNLLTEVAADGSIQPELAESWEASPDAVIWTIKLRQGVVFHNGKTMSADDVIASIDHHRGEDSKSAAKPAVAPIEVMKKVDANTIEFTLKAGDADFPYSLADYHLVIVPANADGTANWQDGIGTGPYKIDNFDPGVSGIYTRNENYFKKDRAWFDGIEMLSIVDPTARVTALISGQVHAIDRVPLKVAKTLKRNPTVVVQEVAGNQHYTFAMHTTADPFKDNNVRQAIKYGVDRQELVDKVLNGFGVIGNDHPIGRGQRFFAKDLAQKAYDPDKSKWHLKQAGLDSVSCDLSAADAAFEGAVNAALLFSDKAKAGGVNINVLREPNDGYWSNVWLKKPFTAVYWSGRPTEDAMFSSAYAKGVAWNDTFWDNTRFNELLLDARAELDQDKRRAMYYEMQDLCSNDGGTVIPMFASYVFAHSAKVKHDTLATNWDMDGEKWAERWWLE